MYVTDAKVFWAASACGIHGTVPVVAFCSNFESGTYWNRKVRLMNEKDRIENRNNIALLESSSEVEEEQE